MQSLAFYFFKIYILSDRGLLGFLLLMGLLLAGGAVAAAGIGVGAFLHISELLSYMSGGADDRQQEAEYETVQQV